MQHNNFQTLFKLEDPYKLQMYDVPVAQMDRGAKCTVTNNINLLKNVRWYDQWFCPKARMRGTASNNVIVPQTEGFFASSNYSRRKID